MKHCGLEQSNISVISSQQIQIEYILSQSAHYSPPQDFRRSLSKKVDHNPQQIITRLRPTFYESVSKASVLTVSKSGTPNQTGRDPGFNWWQASLPRPVNKELRLGSSNWQAVSPNWTVQLMVLYFERVALQNRQRKRLGRVFWIEVLVRLGDWWKWGSIGSGTGWKPARISVELTWWMSCSYNRRIRSRSRCSKKAVFLW